MHKVEIYNYFRKNTKNIKQHKIMKTLNMSSSVQVWNFGSPKLSDINRMLLKDEAMQHKVNMTPTFLRPVAVIKSEMS